jgi:hypothetical protein
MLRPFLGRQAPREGSKRAKRAARIIVLNQLEIGSLLARPQDREFKSKLPESERKRPMLLAGLHVGVAIKVAKKFEELARVLGWFPKVSVVSRPVPQCEVHSSLAEALNR